MAGTVDLPPPVSRSLAISPEMRAELNTARAALTDWRFWLKAALIIAAPLWIYWQIVYGGWLMDDSFYLTGNALLGDPNRLWLAWFQPGSFIEYYPIHESFQWAQWQMWGDNPKWYHATNIFLHIFSSLLVWRLLSKFHLAWAWVGGLIFAIHPTLVETVVWPSELKNTLSLPPFLLAMCFFIEYDNHRRPRDFYFAIASFVIAMLCKISMMPFPAAILLYAWWKRGRIGWSDLRGSAPFWGIAFGIALVSLWCGQIFASTHRMDITFTTGGLPFRIAVIGQTLSFYLATCVWPFGLQPMYVRWPLDHPTLLQFLPWPLTAAAVYWCWTNRATWGRHVLLGFGFFVLFISPNLGIYIISYMRLTWVMDHFVYIAIIGLIGLAVAGLEALSHRFSFTGSLLLYAAVFLATLDLTLGSHWYAAKFIDQKTLWTYAIEVNPKAYTAYNNYGSIILSEGKVEEAFDDFTQAVKYYPDYFEAHYNRGLTLRRLGRTEESLAELRRATELSPRSLPARLFYADTLVSAGYPYEAIHQYEIAAEENPDDARIHSTLGGMLVNVGRIPDAAREFNEAIRLYPDAASPHNDLGNVLFLMGQREAAINEYREAVRLSPQMAEAHNNLGGALQETGHLDEAVEEFREALKIDPTNSKLNSNLADALMAAGHRDEAIKLYELALHYEPGNKHAQQQLAIATGKPLPTPPATPLQK
jgi:tetratricopeptide (TPR) repeat protein